MKTGGTRKGFKFVTASKPIVTETITFDDVEKEGTTTPGASRKRGATRAAEAKAAKQRKMDGAAAASSKNAGVGSGRKPGGGQGNNESPVNKKSPLSGVSPKADQRGGDADKAKAHYPPIDLPVTKIHNILKKSNFASKSHAEILDRIVVEVCAAEQAGLDQFFASNQGKGREAIHQILTTVLDQIPTSVTSTCEEDAEFLPEFVPGEKNEVVVLTDVLEGLRKQRQQLEAYESSLDGLARDHDLWLDGPPQSACEAFRKTHERGPVEDSKLEMAAAAKAFSESLQEIQESCDSVLADLKVVKETEEDAEKVQEKLYRHYNRVRLQVGPSGVTLPAGSSKGLIRGFAASS